MEDYTITKERVLELANKAEQGCTNVIKSDLKNWFPEAFKKEFSVGNWYKIDDSIFYCTEVDEVGVLFGYGLFHGIWGERFVGNSKCACNELAAEDRLVEATPQEVETALIAESKRRGYKKGNFKCPLSRESQFSENYNEWYFEILTNRLYTKSEGEGGACIFEDGKWSEISHPGKQVISMKKALKIIAKKLKVSPEDIRILS